MITVEKSEYWALMTMRIPHPDGDYIIQEVNLSFVELVKFIKQCEAVRDEIRDTLKEVMNDYEQQ